MSGILEDDMYVTKRPDEYGNTALEPVSFDKILTRLKTMGSMTPKVEKLNYTALAMKVIDQLYDKIESTKIDELCAEQCASMSSTHPDYNVIASRIIVSNHHKNTSDSFSQVMKRLRESHDKQGNPAPLVSDELYMIVCQNASELDQLCDYSLDYLIDYFGFKTLERAYLMRIGKNIVERPQHMWLRVAIGIHGADLERVKETYYYMSHKYFTHATPTLFNAGTPRPQLSSCYLLSMESDSIDGIYNTLKDCALISKMAGGIGLHIHNVRATGSYIRGTNGTSNGIVPMLRVFNNTAKYVDQGGGKRNGSFAIYLEPWHGDIQTFLQMRKNHGDEEMKARDLFYALWIPDLFMKRVKSDGHWTLMCPDECPGLADVYGKEFDDLYESYEREGRGRETIKARDLWFQILDAQMETGTPYILYKDAANQKSNQKNVGTIKSSNLCVAPETPILTDRGYIPIRTLVENQEDGIDTNAWNGEKFVKVNVMQTGANRPIIKVKTSDGAYLECTPYHKFFIRSHTTIEPSSSPEASSSVPPQANEFVIKEAGDLKPGDEIIRAKYPHSTTSELFGNVGEKRMAIISEYLITYNNMCNTCEYEYNGKTFGLVSFDHELLYSMKLKLQFCGVNGVIDYVRRTAKYVFYIYTADMLTLMSLGLHPTSLEIYAIFKNITQHTATYAPLVKVVEVCDNGRIADTYCFHEQEKQTGFFNGIITSQCTEIIEYSDENETAVCNLASIALPAFVSETDNRFDFDYDKLHEIAKVVTVNLNRIIDVNFYPTEKTRRSNMRHRPVGIGVQGLADVFMRLGISFVCEQAKKINRRIFETIYHGALEASMELAKKEGAYETFSGSPASEGILQFDLWLSASDKSVSASDKSASDKSVSDKSVSASDKSASDKSASDKSASDKSASDKIASDKSASEKSSSDKSASYKSASDKSESDNSVSASDKSASDKSASDKSASDKSGGEKSECEDYFDWETLKAEIKKHGIRNSLLIAPMPTASTSQILGYNECIEPITSNIYSRRTLAGEFIIANKYLMTDLISLGLWTEKVKNSIIANHGSIQHLESIPEEIREKYKTVWELPMRQLIDMAADRGAFICQSQSLNLWLEDPNYNSLTSMHFYAWSKGLKTGIYYLRRRAKHQAQQFTIEPEKQGIKIASTEEDDICEMCSA